MPRHAMLRFQVVHNLIYIFINILVVIHHIDIYNDLFYIDKHHNHHDQACDGPDDQQQSVIAGIIECRASHNVQRPD